MNIRLQLILFAVLLATSVVTIATPPRWQVWDDVQSIHEDWHYIESDAEQAPQPVVSTDKVDLPHTWNARDALENRDYRRGASWYQKRLEFPPDLLAQSKRFYLRCEGAGQSAVVYLNGQLITQHVGGYTAFTCEITPYLKPGHNDIAIRVSNAHDRMRIPLSGDFNQYGGLYRNVSLITAPAVGFKRDHFGGPGIRIWNPEISAEQATTRVEARLSNGKTTAAHGRVEAALVAPDGTIVAESSQVIEIQPNADAMVSLSFPLIKNPKLWSPVNPQLYTLRISYREGEACVDQARIQHGFRWFEFTPDDGFFLNGELFRLIGINRHQDREGLGNALLDQHHEEDLQLMKEIGVNYLRLAHYPQDDFVLQRCNELGILVQEEIPFVNQATFDPAFEENTYQMAREMVSQHINHPAIIVWGMANEIHMEDRGDGKARCYAMISRLHNLIHQLDPTRKTLLVSNDSETPSKLGVMDIPDINGYNIYQGWYGENLQGLTGRARHLHQLNPDKPLIVTEFGAGSDRRLHSAQPIRYDFTEEYQVKFLEAHFDQMDSMPWLAGFNWWAFADFGSSHRRDSIPHVNQKGLVTFSREKKDSFYLWKARFGKAPVLHIQSGAWKERYGPVAITARVFTNLAEVELWHNGQSLGTRSEDFNWPLSMVPGTNTLRAIARDGEGKVHRHNIQFDYLGDRKFLKISDTSRTRSYSKNLVDGSSFTHWFGRTPAHVEIDLETPSLVDGIILEPYQGTEKSYQLKVSGRVSSDAPWEILWSGQTKIGETFTIPQEKQVEWRFIRLDSERGDENRFLAINEIHVETSTERTEKGFYERVGAGD